MFASPFEPKPLKFRSSSPKLHRAFTEIVSYNQNLAVCNFCIAYAFNVSYTRSHQPQVQNYNAAICQLGIVQRILHIQMKQHRLLPHVVSTKSNQWRSSANWICSSGVNCAVLLFLGNPVAHKDRQANGYHRKEQSKGGCSIPRTIRRRPVICSLRRRLYIQN